MSGVSRRRYVIVAEGKRDTTFLDELVASYSARFDVNCVDIPSKPEQALKRHESNEFRTFESRGYYDVLLKSEGSRPNLEKVFHRLLSNFGKLDVVGAVLIDLDGDSLDSLVADLNERIDERVPREARLVSVDAPDRYHDIVCGEYEYQVGDSTACQLSLVAFRESLEAAAGIDKGSDSVEEMNEKARALVDDDRVRGPIIC